MPNIKKSTQKTEPVKVATTVKVSSKSKSAAKKQTVAEHQKKEATSVILKNDYKKSLQMESVKPQEIAQTQVWVMAAVLYSILAFYEFFYRADWVAGVLNILLGAIFISFVWKK